MTEEKQVTEEPLYCIGCGAQIQTTDPKAAGYTPASALAKQKEGEGIYCQRCFRLRHYNEVSDVQLTDDDFLRLLNQIGQVDALIVNVIDIFDFNGSVIPGLHRFVGKNPVILVGNKADVLPKSVKPAKIKRWLMHQAKEQGLKPLDVVLVSAEKGWGVEDLMAEIDKERKGRDVYVVGTTNVGKSTLINRIISDQTGMQDLITTSRFPGTTLDRIEIPLDDGHQIVDTPGIVHREQMAHYLSAKDLKLVTPTKPIKPKVYQLNEGQTLFLAGLARFDYLSGGRHGFVAYLDNQLFVHRTKTSNADDFYRRQLGKLLQPPRPNEVADFPPLVRYEFHAHEKSDLVFSGLGWITVPANTQVAGYAPEGVSVVLRSALI
ncbi:GTPase YqeH [Lactobacillus selangorensis]|uniref:GTPase YqeH n=1 Tax=Lactobacillus selangorensis TaxID=81857 RepID=A0A0R2FZ28_9LACO|nr:ribosome biogenesis GTPase YqeH [Lactobacillus selangorensis]KRN29734.1 GTPase YqeH [Lactobacillus selangorensis]KRN33737.1 GTPase YqeH [Lactobacillus selangorensis]